MARQTDEEKRFSIDDFVMTGEKSKDVQELFVFNKYHWALEWPKLWIITLGILLILLDLIILGMEIGHTVADV